MYTIYKHILKPEYKQTITFNSSQILSAEEQNDNIVLYYTVNKEANFQFNYEIMVLGTGHETDGNLDVDWKFLNTVKMNNGNLMFHVFYKEV